MMNKSEWWQSARRADRDWLESDLIQWEVGPYHPSLPGAMKLWLELDGEMIVGARTRTGFLHRGIEKAIEGHQWFNLLPYLDHVAPEAPIFGQLVFALAVEQLGNIQVPLRAQMIRVIVCELSRMSSHLASIAKLAKAADEVTVFHYVMRDREKVLDVLELLSGSRFAQTFVRYGGVSADVTEGFLERVLEHCDLIRIRLKEYNDLLTFNQIFMGRTQNVGLLALKDAQRLGISGPNLRASGSSLDVRKLFPYCTYDRLDFEVPHGSVNGGDAHGRLLLRIRELSQSIEILKELIDVLAETPLIAGEVGEDFAPPAGEAYVKVESPQGTFGCYVVSDGSKHPVRVQFRTPSQAALAAVPRLLTGVFLEDAPIILASLDLVIAEVDR